MPAACHAMPCRAMPCYAVLCRFLCRTLLGSEAACPAAMHTWHAHSGGAMSFQATRTCCTTSCCWATPLSACWPATCALSAMASSAATTRPTTCCCLHLTTGRAASRQGGWTAHGCHGQPAPVQQWALRLVVQRVMGERRCDQPTSNTASCWHLAGGPPAGARSHPFDHTATLLLCMLRLPMGGDG